MHSARARRRVRGYDPAGSEFQNERFVLGTAPGSVKAERRGLEGIAKRLTAAHGAVRSG